MGGGAAGGLWCHQQWSPSWILSPRKKTQENLTVVRPSVKLQNVERNFF